MSNMLRTANQIMSIATKAHYLNGGNASKILAKDKKGIFTIEQVAQTLNVDVDELHNLLIEKGIMCGDYVIIEEWGDNDKLSTYALRTLKDAAEKPEQIKTPISWLSIIVICVGLELLFNETVAFIIVGFLVFCKYAIAITNFVNEHNITEPKTYKEMREDAKAMQEQLPDDHKAKGMM